MKHIYMLSLCLLMATSPLFGQRGARKAGFNQSGKSLNTFLHKQWWLGFKAGPNLSKPTVERPYYVISPTNYDEARNAKQYENFKSLGSQVTFEVTFYFRNLSVSFQPTYRTSVFAYANDYEWIDSEEPGNYLSLHYNQRQKVASLDWPLIAKYEFQTGKVIPYVQLGVYSSMLLDATKEVSIRGTDRASGGEHEFEAEPVIIGATDLFAKYHWGAIAGAGLYYPLGNVRLTLDLSYRIGMSNIASTANRYGSDRLSGVGDSLDDIKLDNLMVSVGCLFPLRFLGSGFKSMID